MPFDRRALQHVALLARLDVSDEELTRYTEQLERIVAAVERIDELDLEALEPTTLAVPIDAALRPDREARSLPPESALEAAPSADGVGFVVPRVVGGGDG